MNELQKQFYIFVIAMLSYITTHLVVSIKNKWKIARDEKNNSLENILDLHTDVNYLINDLLLEVFADRASIFLFHNGQKSSSGIHFLKFSMKWEAVKPGIARDKHNNQNFNVEDYNIKLRELMKTGYRIIENVQMMQDCPGKNILIERGAKSFYCCLIKDKKNVPICIIAVDYLYYQDNINKREITEALTYYSRKIAKRLKNNKKNN